MPKFKNALNKDDYVRIRQIKARILSLAENKGVTVDQLSRHLNLSTRVLYSDCYPTLKTMLVICNYFHISLDYLVFGEETNEN